MFDFRGDAVKYSNPDIVKDVTGNIVMELVDLGDVNAKLRIVGGDFTVIGSESEGDGNVWDVSFGRARVLLERDVIQLNINAVDLSGQHGMFRMHAETTGAFPLEVGDVMDVHAFAGRTSIAGAWELNFDGTISIDDVVPIEEFDDVETDVQAALVSLEITEEATDEIIDDVDVNLADILTDEELADFTQEEIEEIEAELEAEIIAEIEDEIVDEIETDVATTVDTTVDAVEAEFDDLEELDLASTDESDSDAAGTDVNDDGTDANGDGTDDGSDATVNLDDGAGSTDG